MYSVPYCIVVLKNKKIVLCCCIKKSIVVLKNSPYLGEAGALGTADFLGAIALHCLKLSLPQRQSHVRDVQLQAGFNLEGVLHQLARRSQRSRRHG